MQGASRNFGAVNGALNPRGDDCGRRPSQKNRRARGKALRRLKGWPQIRELGALADRGVRKVNGNFYSPRYQKIARLCPHGIFAGTRSRAAVVRCYTWRRGRSWLEDTAGPRVTTTSLGGRAGFNLAAGVAGLVIRSADS